MNENLSTDIFTTVLNKDLNNRINRVNSIVGSVFYFDSVSDTSGRKISGNVCVPEVLQEDRIIVVPGQLMSTAKNTVATNAAIAEATGLVVVGLELPGHGKSDRATKKELEQAKNSDYSWLAAEYDSVLASNEFINKFDSKERFVYGISAGAVAASNLVAFGDSKYAKVAFLDPASIAPGSRFKKSSSFLYEFAVENDKGFADLEKYNKGLTIAKTGIDPRALATFTYMTKNYPRHGETTQSIIRFLEKYPDMNTLITLCSESRVVAKDDEKYLRGQIDNMGARVASRVSIETIDGINHNIGRYPLVVGQLAARAFED